MKKDKTDILKDRKKYIWKTKYELANFMHNEYERLAKKNNWETQKITRVLFSKLPLENQQTMLELSKLIMKFFEKKGVIGHDDYGRCICIPKEVFEE